MSGAVCKAAICRAKAQAELSAIIKSLELTKDEKPEIVIQCSEAVLKTINPLTKELIKITS